MNDTKQTFVRCGILQFSNTLQVTMTSKKQKKCYTCLYTIPKIILIHKRIIINEVHEEILHRP